MEQYCVEHSSGFDTYDIYYNSRVPVEGISVVSVNSDYVFTPVLHRHRFYELFINIGGRGTHHVDFNSYDISPGYVYCIRPGQLHRIDMASIGSGYIIMFHSDFLMTYSPLCRPDQMACFFSEKMSEYVPISEYMVACVSHLYQTQQLSECHKPLLMASILTTLLVKIQQSCDAFLVTIPSYSSISTRFFNTLSHVLPPKKTVQAYASLLHINASYLNSVVKQDTGKTAGKWIQEARLLEAKRLLTHSEISIDAIAAQLQFSETSAFCRFFKTNTSITPLQFRDNYSSNLS